MSNQPKSQATRCTATTRGGQPCRGWAVPGTDPPRCAPHGGVAARPGAPEGNQNACTHGMYAKQWGRACPEWNPAARQSARCLRSRCRSHRCSPLSHSAAECRRRRSRPDHGLYIIRDMLNKYRILSGYIDRHQAELSLPALLHSLNQQGQIATRISRLLRDQTHPRS